MTFVYVDEHGFVRSSEDNRILGVKTGDTQDGHIAYIANGVVSGEGVDLSKVSPVYITEEKPPVIPAESVKRTFDAFNDVLQKAYAKAAEYPELEWTFEVRVDEDGKPSIEARGTPRVKDDPDA